MLRSARSWVLRSVNQRTRVGLQDDAAAPAVQCGRGALVDVDREPQVPQQQRSGEAADRATDDDGGCSCVFGHDWLFSVRWMVGSDGHGFAAGFVGEGESDDGDQPERGHRCGGQAEVAVEPGGGDGPRGQRAERGHVATDAVAHRQSGRPHARREQFRGVDERPGQGAEQSETQKRQRDQVFGVAAVERERSTPRPRRTRAKLSRKALRRPMASATNPQEAYPTMPPALNSMAAIATRWSATAVRQLIRRGDLTDDLGVPGGDAPEGDQRTGGERGADEHRAPQRGFDQAPEGESVVSDHGAQSFPLSACLQVCRDLGRLGNVAADEPDE